MRKLLTFWIALGALVFAIVSPASANGVLFLAGPPAGRSCTDDTASGNFLARTSGLSNKTKDAVCNLIKTLESNSIITGTLSGANSGAAACGSVLDVLYIFVTDNSATSLLNICGTSYSLTQTGSCTFTADAGVACDGSTGFFSTGFTASTATTPNFATNSGTVGVYLLNNRTVSGSKVAIGSTNSGSGRQTLIDPFNGSGTTFDISDGIFPTGTNTTSLGALVGTRTSATALNLYKNGSATAIGTSATTCGCVVFQVPLTIAARNNDSTGTGVADSFSNDTLGAAFAGVGMTSTQAVVTNNALNTYMSVRKECILMRFRYPANPIAANPSRSVAQVEGSGILTIIPLKSLAGAF